MEGRLGAAMVRAQGRLRIVRQGSHRLGSARWANSPRDGWKAAAWISVRDVARRGRSQGFEVGRPRSDGRSMDALCADRSAQNVPAAQSAARAKIVSRGDSSVRRRISRRVARLRGGIGGAASRIDPGIRDPEHHTEALQFNAQLRPDDECRRGAGQFGSRFHLAIYRPLRRRRSRAIPKPKRWAGR